MSSSANPPRWFTKKRYWLAASVILAIILLTTLRPASPTSAQGTKTYTDPGGRFTAIIPPNWKDSSTEHFGAFVKDDVTIYVIAVKAATVQDGLDAALAQVAPTFIKANVKLINSGDAPAANGIWKENVYEAKSGAIYYTDTQVRGDTVFLVITSAPNLVTLMLIANDVHTVIVSVKFTLETGTPTAVPPTATKPPVALSTTPVSFPALSGKYQVGRTIFSWLDKSRPELYTLDESDKRSLSGWAWYPAEAVNAPVAPYAAHEMVALMKQSLGVDPAKISGHAFADAPLAPAERSYPVIVFSPGNGTNSVFYTAMLEELASHGYIIFGIDHTYNTLLTTLPDGKVIPGIREAQDQSTDDFNTRVADIRFVIDQITALNSGTGQFAGHLDLKHLGLMGHSFGGAASAQACREDVRCQAVTVMDVPLEGKVAKVGLTQPTLLLDAELLPCEAFAREVKALSSDAPFGIGELCEAIMANRRAGWKAVFATSAAAYHISIKGARHGSFGDIPFLLKHQPALQPNMGGLQTIEAERSWRVISDFLLAFYGKHLRGENVPLLNGPTSDYPEVIF